MSSPKVGFLILAAGESRRMGSPKQVLNYRGKPLVVHSLDQVPGSCVVLVLGAHMEAILPVLPAKDIRWVYNPAWSSGPGCSIRVGCKALLQKFPGLDSIMVLLADQPLVDTKLIQELLSKAQKNPGKAVAVKYPQGPGVPALFPRSYFRDLMALHDKQGAKDLLRNSQEHVCMVEAGGKELDIDTPEDYHKLTGEAWKE